MGDYRYSVIRGIDFYEFVQKHLITHPNVEFIQASISDYRETTDGATVHTDSGDYTARWIFTSIMDKNTIREATASSIYLKQHFKGFVIETKEPTFDPDAFTMFDFRTPQNGLMRFFYVLPQSETRALVEYTLFSEDLLEKPAYDQAIAEYIRHVLNIKDYRVVDEEFGIIPMTTYRFPVLRSPHVVNIGSVAGSSKPSSGYTFTRIQKHVREIVSALESGRSPVVDANSPARYRFYDAVLLNILKNRGGQGADIFSQLFKNNPVGNIFRFLDETGGLKNDLKVLLSLPPWPFLKSAVQLLRNRQDKNSF